MISVLIATRHRPREIIACVTSLLASTDVDFEIIVVDQSRNTATRKALSRLKNPKIVCRPMRATGKSRALNLAIDMAHGDILAFTDDDCIVPPEWLGTIRRSMETHADSVAVFGQTKPYEPGRHKGSFCLSVFLRTTPTKITKPLYHADHIGFGNNMAIRTSAIQSVGGFKSWLGPGSIGSNAEDAQMALMLLIKGHTIFYTPKAIVYHDKWLKAEELFGQNLSYSCGEMACYGYFLLQGHRFAGPIVRANIRDSFIKTKHIGKQILLGRWNKELFTDMYATAMEIWYRSRGLFIGFIFSLIDPL